MVGNMFFVGNEKVSVDLNKGIVERILKEHGKKVNDFLVDNKRDEAVEIMKNDAYLFMTYMYRKHKETVLHSYHTAMLCEFLAKTYIDFLRENNDERLNAEDEENLIKYSKISGFLHDIGKLDLMLTDEGLYILGKDQLTKEEFAKFIISHEFNYIVEYFAVLFPEIKEHHEKLDGSGYRKVTAEFLNWMARMLAGADVFSALTLPREYRTKRANGDFNDVEKKAKMTKTEAINILKSMSVDQLFVNFLTNFKFEKEDVEKLNKMSVEEMFANIF